MAENNIDLTEFEDQELRLALRLSMLDSDTFDKVVEQLEKQRTSLENNDITSVQQHMDEMRARMPPEDKVATAGMLFQEFLASRSESFLNPAILLLRDAVGATPDASPRKAGYLEQLAIHLHARYSTFAHADDFNSLIFTMQELLERMADEEERKVLHLSNLGDLFMQRYSRLKQVDDLNLALETYQRGATIASGDHIHRGTVLTGLARGLMARSLHDQDPNDHEIALITLQEAVELPFHSPELHAVAFNALADALRARYGREKRPGDLDASIDATRSGAELFPDTDPNKAVMFKRLAADLRTRFDSTHSISDLSALILVMRECTTLPHASSDARGLHELGTALWQRFDVTGDIQDINEAVQCLKQAASLEPKDPSLLSALGVSLVIRFERFGVKADLQEAVATHERAVDLVGEGNDQALAGVLINLGNALQMRFESLGDIEDIDAAIIAQRKAVDLLSEQADEKLMALNMLGTAYHRRFDRLREKLDMSASLSCKQAAFRFIKPGHPLEAQLLNGVGAAWLLCFDVDRELDALENAITALRRSVELTPENHSHKSARLHNLSHALYEQYQYSRDEADLSSSIAVQEKAVTYIPDDSPWRKAAALNSLGSSLLERFQLSKVAVDVDKAISILHCAVDIIPADHIEAANFSATLGKAYLARHELNQLDADIEQAIRYLGVAARAPSKPLVSQFVSAVKWARLCVEHRSPSEGLAAYRVVLGQIPRLIWHGSKLHRRFEDIEQMRVVVPEAVAVAISANDLTTAVEWADEGRCIVWGQMLQVLGAPIDTLREVAPKLAEELQTVSRELAESWNVDSLRSSRYVSEHAKRRPRDKLRQISPQALTLMRAMLQITSPEKHEGPRAILAQPPVGAPSFEDRMIAFAVAASGMGAGEMTLEAPSDQDLLLLATAHDNIGKEHRQLTAKYEELLEKAQEILPGFKDFSRVRGIAELRATARNGAVILINMHHSRCDALALTFSSDDVVHIPLPAFPESVAQTLLTGMLDVLSTRGRSRSGSSSRAIRMPSQKMTPALKFEAILRQLWLHVVQPILNALEGKLSKAQGKQLPRVTWCPSGPLAFLPLHAAGIYDPDDPNYGRVFDHVVSSYTPSITALRNAQRLEHIQAPRAVAISQPDTPDEEPLPFTQDEVQAVQRCLPNLTWLDGPVATKKTVLEAIKNHEWVHLACHALQDSENPAKSAFSLEDGYLELLDIMKQPLPQARLAVLSACQTATGDEKYPEEAVHLAAGMLTAGYKSVVATMWSIDDEDAPIVAQHLYGFLMSEAGGNSDESAYALHYATEKLRDQVGETSFMRWLPFVHVGA